MKDMLTDPRDVLTLASELARGTSWAVLGAERAADRDAWLVLLEHERGDRRVAAFSEIASLDVAIRALNDALAAELPFAGWKKGDPPPSFALPLAFDALECERTDTPPDIGSFVPGMLLVVTAVDLERMTATLVPASSPWGSRWPWEAP